MADCNKSCHYGRKEAKRVLKLMILRKKMKTGYVYRCELCRAYHITSYKKDCRQYFDNPLIK